jgi:hypothetical protein
MIEKYHLEKLYLEDRVSMMDIALKLGCSPNKVVYWMDKHQIKRRTISEAIYQKANPNGDPFCTKPIKTKADAELLGMGIGLYWGEGAKTSLHSLKLGNTDPALIRMFMKFLVELFGVDRKDFKFALQIFTDIDPEEALQFWISQLGVERSQFYRPTVTISGSIGTYRKKSEHGVALLHYHNKKLRDIVVGLLPT